MSGRRADDASRPVECDAVVVGSGVAGLTTALGLSPRRVALLTKTSIASGSSTYAQGGIAVALAEDDSPELHASDTLAASDGLADPVAVRRMTDDGPRYVQRLIELGTGFDRGESGELALGREGAHSRRRILHAGGDATGAEIVRALVQGVHHASSIAVHEQTFAIDLVVRDGEVGGVIADGPKGRLRFAAPAVVIATGGLGRIYLFSTNPLEATGDGHAMAARAGALMVDMEFVQFHPTALDAAAARLMSGDTNGRAARNPEPIPLLTEALRGEGAILVDDTGERFMPSVHPLAELAPRDVVSRAIWSRESSGREVFLDAREAVGEKFPSRFPTVFESCMKRGIDPRIDLIPISPAAHFHMGGIAVDPTGRATLEGLWACGEVAASGVHGANRLASNSLLEALVYGARVAEDIGQSLDSPHEMRSASGTIAQPETEPGPGPAEVAGAAGTPSSRHGSPSSGSKSQSASSVPEVDDRDRAALACRKTMWDDVGLVRSGASLERALVQLDQLEAEVSPDDHTTRNMIECGRLVATAALERTESRGAHYRSDYPRSDPAWERRLYLQAAPRGRILDIEIVGPTSAPGEARSRKDRL